MNILYINPYTPIPDNLAILHPPLGIGYLTTALKKAGHKVSFIDMPIIDGDKFDALTKQLGREQFGLIGITCVTITYAIAIKIAKFVKQLYPNIPIAMGGPHVTFTAKETLERFSCVDFIIMHDGEEASVQLVEALENNDASFSKICGLAYRDATGKIYVNKLNNPTMDLDVYGFPDRTIFDIPYYLNRDYETVIMTSRGCPNRCAFCSTSVMGRVCRFHSIEHVIDEIKLVLELGFQSVFFGDDTFPADKQRTFNLCNEIIKRGLKFDWTCNMRVIDVEPHLIKLMHQAGMYRTFIGYESFDEETLTRFKKGSNVDMQIKAAEILRAEGVELHSSMIVGGANDTEDSVIRNVEFLRSVIRPTIATFNTIELRPGTDAYLHPEKYGYHISNKYWYENLDCINGIHVRTDNLSEIDIRRLCAKCYEKFYS